MNKDEMQEKLSALSEKMKVLEDKTKDAIDTAKIAGMYAGDKMNEILQEAKCNVNAMKENYIIFSERAKGKASSELIKARLNFEAAKKELEEKKEAHDKAKAEEYIEDMEEYLEACIELSLLAAEEAKLAVVGLVKAQKAFEEKYDNK